MTTSSTAIPKTSRPRKLAGSDERPASTNTLEETSMFSEKGSALLGRANNPSGPTGNLPVPDAGASYDEIKTWLDARDAGFEHAPYCDHPYNGPHPCSTDLPSLPGAAWSCRKIPAVVFAGPYCDEVTQEPSVMFVVEKPRVEDEPPDDVFAEAWLTPSTARAFAAQLLESARIVEGTLSAVAESDAQLTELGVLFRRVEAGDFATVDEVGAALRRIAGAA